MFARLLRRGFVTLALLVGSCCLAAPKEHLSEIDVPKVMEQLLDYHVEVKELSPDLLKRSYVLYLEQADPLRHYLLQSEVSKYANASKEQLTRAMEQYRRSDLAAYRELDALIAEAIKRAHGWRRRLIKEVSAQMEAGKDLEVSKNRVAPPFAKSEEELQRRQLEQMYRFAERQLKNVKQSDVHKRLPQVWALYERRIQALENPYLQRDRRSKALSDEAREHELAVRVLKALSKSLDAHTAYFSPEEAHAMRTQLQQGFTGIGVVLEDGLGGVTVTRLIEGGPAARSGRLRLNDRIVSVDAQSVVSVPFEEVMEMIRGPRGSSVLLGIARGDSIGDESFFEVALMRQEVSLDQSKTQSRIEYHGDGVIGIIRLDSFYEGAGGASSVRAVRNSIRDFKKQGELKGLVLDLRDNLGGFLSQAIKVAGLFITNGVVAMSRYSDGETLYFRDVNGYAYFDGPMVVLTSKVSASAAEIVAQALQDYGQALVVGDPRTYGKGSIQHQTITDAEADAYFKVTVGRYYTVSGRSTQISGVKADIVVPSHLYDEDIGEEHLDYPLACDSIEPAYEDSLEDIDPAVRHWFAKYYLPTLQQRKALWHDNIEMLRKNSAHRLENSRNFQLFLEVLNGDEGSTAEVQRTDYGAEDLQLQEGINVLKDMILLEVQAQATAN